MNSDQIETLKRAESLFADRAEESISECKNQDLAKFLLLKAACNTQSHKSLVEKTGLPELEIQETFQYLISEGLVEISYERWDTKKTHPQINLTPGIKDGYVRTSRMQGPHRLLEIKDLTPQRALKAMQAVQDIVSFHYEKRFSFEIEHLHRIRERTYEKVKQLQEEESRLFHEIFEIAQNWSNTPSFVGRADPTWIDGAGYIGNFTLQGAFSTPAEGLQAGFDKAMGSPITQREYSLNYDGTTRNLFPCVQLLRDNNLYDLSLDNTLGSSAVHGTFAFYQETKAMLPILKGKLELALSK